MRYLIQFAFIALIGTQHINAQLIFESKDGDALFSPIISNSGSQTTTSVGVINLNTGNESIGFDYINAKNSIGKPKYKFWTLGAKAKPSEGYAAVLKTGQFSPNVIFSGSLAQVKIFDKEKTKDPENGFLDWGSIYFNYTTSKYQLFKIDTTFKNQLYSTSFSGFGIGVNYNALIKSTYLISLKLGYSRKNNYDDLPSIQINDKKSVFDSTTMTTRDVLISKTAKQGVYKEFDGYPISLSFTKLTADDPTFKGLAFGYIIYINALPNNNGKPKTNAGVILYLAKMKDGISTPSLGLNCQFGDFFDVQGSNNGLLKRLSIGFTTSISIY